MWSKRWEKPWKRAFLCLHPQPTQPQRSLLVCFALFLFQTHIQLLLAAPTPPPKPTMAICLPFFPIPEEFPNGAAWQKKSISEKKQLTKQVGRLAANLLENRCEKDVDKIPRGWRCLEGSCPFSLLPAGPSCPGHAFPSGLHGMRPIPVLKELPQALQVDRGEVGADPFPDPPLPIAGVLPPGLAELVLEVFAPDPPVGDRNRSSGLGRASGKRLGPCFSSLWCFGAFLGGEIGLRVLRVAPHPNTPSLH